MNENVPVKKLIEYMFEFGFCMSIFWDENYFLCFFLIFLTGTFHNHIDVYKV